MWKFIGQSPGRLNAKEKVTGRTVYAVDLKLQGKPPYYGKSIVRIKDLPITPEKILEGLKRKGNT
jgi:CO/xanthine dehydrogenase Mo-binding subunit